jgi:hypothetical protein
MRKPFLLGLVLSASFGLAACDIRAENGNFDIDFASGKASDTWSRTYAVQAGGRFELINVNGRITAEATDGKDVVVEATRTAKGRSDEVAKENLAKLEIREEVGDSTVRVESRPPRFSGFGGHEIEWTVKIPKGLIVDLRTVNGGVRMNGLSGAEVYAKSTNGGVIGRALVVDKLDASVVNGGVTIDLASPLDSSDSIEVSSVNGGVSLALPVESRATITARAVNGGVRVSDELKADQEPSNESERRRRFQGTMNGGGGRVEASTTNGGVRILKSGSPTT